MYGMALDRRCTAFARLMDWLYFGARLHRVRSLSPRTEQRLSRHERLRREYGPPFRLVVVVSGTWLAVLLAVARLFIVMKSGG
jgi:hypothetical protein